MTVVNHNGHSHLRVMHIYRPIRNYRNSYALLADCEVKDTAVVFVHGFRGHPRKTWLLFQSLIDDLQAEFPAWRAVDLFFYGYDAFGAGTFLNAKAFLTFLQQIFPVPERTLFNMKIERFPRELRAGYKSLVLPIPKQYKRLVLVGHSLGAVIIRASVLEAINNKLALLKDLSSGKAILDELLKIQVLNADVRFFAPAHFGANPAGWLGVALNLPFIGQLLQAWLRYGQAYCELSDPSMILAELRQQTTVAAEAYPALKALRAKSLWGTGEKIVSVGNYKYDFESVQVDSVSHLEICKPTLDYKLPLEFVISYGMEATAANQSGSSI